MLPQTSPADYGSHLHRRGVRRGALLAIWSTIGVIWCGLLPMVAMRPAIKARLDELEARGIDASAMYYTELPAMNEVLRGLQEFRDRHPDDLWVPVWGYAGPADLRVLDESAVRN